MTDVQALTLTIFGEARGEPIEGKLAVAAVIRNRVLAHYNGANTYADVCLAREQFSAWTQEVSTMQQAEVELSGGHADPTLALCEEIARATIAGMLCDPTGGANHYVTTALLQTNPPNWMKGVTGRQIGAQTFVRLA